MRVQVICSLAILSLSVGIPIAKAEEPPALFSNQEQALEFTQSVGPSWGKPTSVDKGDGDYLGFSRPTFFVYPIGILEGNMIIGYDKSGQIGFYEVRYPTLKTKCVGNPETRDLAKKLLIQFEPDYAQNSRDLNFVGSSADLVWPYTAFLSGPIPVVGQTAFRFYKMNGYCSFTVVRFTGSMNPKTAP